MSFNKLFFFFFLLSWGLYSQGNNKLFKLPTPEDRLPPVEDNIAIIEYEEISDKSILWSKLIWEKLDLSQKENQILYYPTDTIGTGKKSLYYTLLNAIKSGRLTAYTDSYFEETKEIKDLLPAIQKRDTTSAGFERLNQGLELTEAYIYQRDISAPDIKEYRLKGVWYFDKRRSELRFRVLGIAPVALDVNFIDEIDTLNSEDYLVELFWIWYPEARPLLAGTPSFNTMNSNFPLSFDRILTSRMFKGQIYKTDNELEDVDALQGNFSFPDFELFPLDSSMIIRSEKKSGFNFFGMLNKSKDSIGETDSQSKPKKKAKFFDLFKSKNKGEQESVDLNPKQQ